MRAILVVNPNATTTTVRSRDVLVRALGSQIDLEVAYTRQRGHAVELARRAARDGIDLVVTLGGDGTVNEVANGLMTADDGPAAGRADERPAVAVVPGGSTNVFARALGLPKDWAEGTGIILEALRAGRTRTVGLGLADDRYFTFCAGFGLDAEVIRRVERARQRGATSTAGLYLRLALSRYLLADSRRRPSIALAAADSDGESDGDPQTLSTPDPCGNQLATVIVQNTAPWTYLGDRAIHACPEASFDLGLDVLALRGMGLASTATTARRMLARSSKLKNSSEFPGKGLLLLHDMTRFTLTSPVPIAFQVDGDYLGERQRLTFSAIPEALRVVC
jgi:diacylglycerol kinase family enzyme